MTSSETTPITQRVRVGRADDNDVVLQDPRVSLHHMELVRRSGGWLVTDLDSGNGTRLNGRPVRQETAADGSLVTVGSTRLRLVPEGVEVLDSSAPPRSAPPSTRRSSHNLVDSLTKALAVIRGRRWTDGGLRWDARSGGLPASRGRSKTPAQSVEAGI